MISIKHFRRKRFNWWKKMNNSLLAFKMRSLITLWNFHKPYWLASWSQIKEITPKVSLLRKVHLKLCKMPARARSITRAFIMTKVKKHRNLWRSLDFWKQNQFLTNRRWSALKTLSWQLKSLMKERKKYLKSHHRRQKYLDFVLIIRVSKDWESSKKTLLMIMALSPWLKAKQHFLWREIDSKVWKLIKVRGCMQVEP